MYFHYVIPIVIFNQCRHALKKKLILYIKPCVHRLNPNLADSILRRQMSFCQNDVTFSKMLKTLNNSVSILLFHGNTLFSVNNDYFEPRFYCT